MKCGVESYQPSVIRFVIPCLPQQQGQGSSVGQEHSTFNLQHSQFLSTGRKLSAISYQIRHSLSTATARAGFISWTRTFNLQPSTFSIHNFYQPVEGYQPSVIRFVISCFRNSKGRAHQLDTNIQPSTFNNHNFYQYTTVTVPSFEYTSPASHCSCAM